jgi:hypothetical protein
MLWLALKLRRDEAAREPDARHRHRPQGPRRADRQDVRGVRVPEPRPGRERASPARAPLRAAGQDDPHHGPEVPGGRRAGAKVASGASREEFPLLSSATNLFVLADEAHRTQYGSLAANLRKALPNACFFGFTGTPIDKKDRSTLQTFGPTSTRTPSSRPSPTAPRSHLLRGPPPRAAHRRAARSTPCSTASSPTAPKKSARRSRRSTGARPRSRARRSASRPFASTSSSTSRSSSSRTASRRRSSP